ncbi:MAG: hypothetical protein J6U89_08350 [Bacteroidaceae bacterium]|nr:hypothetical protein [Bacteroidaceae bacterium]
MREGKENVVITGGETTISSIIETPSIAGWETVGSFTNETVDCNDGNYYEYSFARNDI